jgi:hypothetical protein
VHVEERPPGLRRDAERDGEAGGTSGWDRGVSSSAPEPRLPLHHTAVAAQQVVLVLVDGLLAYR